jgi:hypothetical protein
MPIFGILIGGLLQTQSGILAEVPLSDIFDETTLNPAMWIGNKHFQQTSVIGLVILPTHPTVAKTTQGKKIISITLATNLIA